MFENLLSNTLMKKELENAVRADRPMQAYLFCGSSGSGKKTAAREFAGALVCDGRQGYHPDVIFITPPDGKKLIPTETVRQMRADAFIKPVEGRRKVYIIDGMQYLNDQAQNALLTVLEQPPSFAVFILLSESRGKVLPTVISRCACFDMEYVDANQGARFMHERHPDIPESRLKSAILACGGNLGAALIRAGSDQIGQAIEGCERMLLAASRADEFEAAAVVGKMNKEQLTEFLPILAAYIRDIIAYRCTKNAQLTAFSDSILKNCESFDKINIGSLYSCAQACEHALEAIGANFNPTLAGAGVVINLFGGTQID